MDEATPAAGSNGDNSLVVWKDNRGNNQPYHRGRYRLYGRRFDLNGNALDAASFQIQDEAFLWNNEGLTQPTVGTLGRDYLIVWLTRFRQVSARRVLGDGTVVTNEISIARTSNASGQPAFASTRRGGLVAWTSRTNNSGDIYATLLDKNGEVTGVVPIAVNSANAQHPVAASAGKDYLVLWRELTPSGDGLLKAVLVTPSGAVRHLDDLPARFANWVTVASNGRNYFVAWQTCLGENNPIELMGSMLNGRGKLMREGLRLAASGDEQSQPTVLASGRNFTVSWRENPYSNDASLHALTVSAQGLAKTQPSPMTSDAGWSGYGAATLLGRSNVLVVLEQKTPGYYENGYLSRARGSIVSNTR